MLKVGKALVQAVTVLRIEVVTVTVGVYVVHALTAGMVRVVAVTPRAEQADEYRAVPEHGEA